MFDVDRAADHGDPWILLHRCYHAIPNFVPWGIVLPAWLLHGGLWDELPRPVDTMLTFSTGDSGCPEIFPLSPAGNEAAICASWVSIILLRRVGGGELMRDALFIAPFFNLHILELGAVVTPDLHNWVSEFHPYRLET